MNRTILHRTIRQFRQPFLAEFNQLTEHDLQTILEGQSETLLTVLQHRYGYTRLEAISAWNDFVLRYVNAQPVAPAQRKRTRRSSTRVSHSQTNFASAAMV